MNTIFFDFINHHNKNLLDNLPNNTKNLIIFCLYASGKNKINNLPSTLENIIIYNYTCNFTNEDNRHIYITCASPDDDENNYTNNNYLRKYIFSKMPFGCTLVTLNKYKADKIYWSNNDYNNNICPTNNDIKNKLKYIEKRDIFLTTNIFDNKNNDLITVINNKKINHLLNSTLFEKKKRHLLFELPNIININYIHFYKTQFNLNETEFNLNTDENKSKLIFFDTFIKIYDNKQYLNFVIDEITNGYHRLNDYSIDALYNLPYTFFN